MKKRNNGGFSWNTFLGLTAEKRKISRMLGMPLTKGGRQRKAGAGGFWAAIFTILFDQLKGEKKL